MKIDAWLFPLAALTLSPLLQGIINRIKAMAAGRQGPPLLQPYHDLIRLFRKAAVYSRTTSWIFRAGPVVGLGSTVCILAVLPLGGASAPFPFAGDLILLVYLLGLMRFFTVIAALDTGSAFEGMGASREVQFAVLIEPAMFISLVALGLVGQIHFPDQVPGALSLSGIYAALSVTAWASHATILLLAAVAMGVVLLAENCRIPIDDPNTHLELTMIHEVMVLDHSGPDLGMILYAAALKLWILCALLAGILIPLRTGNSWLDGGAVVGSIFILAAVIGVVESTMARLRLLRVPQLLAGAGVVSALALLLVLWG